MSELGDDYKALKEFNKKKKIDNHEKSIRILMLNNIQFETLSDTHLRIGKFDFWPSTGKFWNRNKNHYGRGIFNLIKQLTQDPKPEGDRAETHTEYK